MKNYLLTISGLVCLLQITAAFAVKVDSVYLSNTPVVSQSSEERVKVEGLALGEVLAKVSGNSHVLDNPKIQTSLSKADMLTQEFSYSPSGIAATPYLLHIRFDPEGVNRILRNSGVASWGQNRPLILAWVEYEAPNQPAVIIDSDTSSTILTLLKANADRRGLPIMLPMMDMTDLNAVKVNNIVTMELPLLQDASKRYGGDTMLVVRVLKNQTGYSIQSKMIMRSKQWEWNFDGKTLDEAITTLMNNAADALAGRYATVVSDTVQSQVTLKVTGVSEQNDFGDLIQYITHLTPVADVEPEQIVGNDVVLKISLRGSREAFIQALSVGQKLQAAASGTDGDVLDYQWNH